MPVDLRTGSPYLNQAVCACPDGDGWQGMSPECCAAAPPAETPGDDGGGSGGGSGSGSGSGSGGGGVPAETTTAAPVEGDDDDEKTVLITETEEPNWLDRDSIVDDVSNKWIAGGSAVVCLILVCLCMICLLLVLR